MADQVVTVEFTADTDVGGFKTGQVKELSLRSAHRWVRRGVARYVAEEAAPAKKVAKKKATTKKAAAKREASADD